MSLCLVQHGKSLPKEIDPARPLSEEGFHLITCSMTFHHVNDPSVLIVQFYRLLHPNGYVCIADLDPDEGKFHSSNKGVMHSGFERTSMRNLFIQAGFTHIRDTTVAIIDKNVPDEGIRSFSVFLMTGQKLSHQGL